MEQENRKPRRPRRSKADIENCINKAAKELVLKKRFSNVTVLDIIKRAKIEPITFYSRYQNQEDFFEHFVREFDYWFKDTMSVENNQVRTEEVYAELLINLLNELSQKSIMLELLRWEISDTNQVTLRTAMNRELHTIPLVDKYEADFKDSGMDISAISSLLVGGIYYLCLHKECAPFCRIDLNTEEGKQKIQNAIRTLSRLLYEHKQGTCSPSKNELEGIAERMRQRGMSEEDIRYCLMK